MDHVLTGDDDYDSNFVHNITPAGYAFHHIPRTVSVGGSSGVLVRDCFKVDIFPNSPGYWFLFWLGCFVAPMWDLCIIIFGLYYD